MLLEVLKSKIHRVTVTPKPILIYIGSITIDEGIAGSRQYHRRRTGAYRK